MPGPQKARVFKNGRTPPDEVNIERNPHTGVLTPSEEPLRPSLNDVYRELDEAGAAEFDIDRDLSLPKDRDCR